MVASLGPALHTCTVGPSATLCHAAPKTVCLRVGICCVSSTLSDDEHSILNPPQSGGDTLIPPAQTSVPAGFAQHSCLPVHHWTMSLPQGQEVLPTSASATSLVTCSH